MAESPGFLGSIKTRELKILAEKRTFLRIARNLSRFPSLGGVARSARVVVPLYRAPRNCKISWVMQRGVTVGRGVVLKGFFSSLLIVFATMVAAPAWADDLCKNLAQIIETNGGLGAVVIGDNLLGKTVTISCDSDLFLEYKIGDWSSNNKITTVTITQDMVNNGRLIVRNRNTYGTLSLQDLQNANVQIERGETATSYSPYTGDPLCATCDGIVKTYESAVGTVSQNGTPTPTNPIEPTFYQQGDMVLRKVGDVADSYDASTGKITRRIGVKTFNGTETLTMFGADVYIKSDASNVAYVLTGNNVGNSGWAVVSNVFSTTSAGIWQETGHPNTARINNRNQMHMNVANDVLGITDYTQETQESVMSKAKAFFKRMYDAGTPVTVYYVLETPVEETVTQTTYCADAIKIATTAYNAAAFAPVEQALESAVTTIKDVVANTIVQADAIQNLQDTKQTMPDASGTNGTCPRFRQCLLIETANGTPEWYPIADPVHDFVTAMKNNKVNSSGQTTSNTFAANGKTDPDSRYYKGYPAMRLQTTAATADVSNRQFASTLLNGTNGGQYKTLGDQEWAATWDGDETGTADSFLPGVIYGTSRCAKTKPASTAPGTEGWTTIENSDALNDLENIESYVQCYCKMTGVGMDGMITPVRDSSQAPWVFNGTLGSAGYCAYGCAFRCADGVRDYASFRQAIMGWAVE